MRVLLVFVIGLVAGQRSYSGNPDGIVFPGPISSRNQQIQTRSENSESAISRTLLLAKQLDELDSIDDFLNMVDGVPDEEKNVPMSSRIGGVERTSAIQPQPAKCIPELQPVPFKHEENDPSVVYYPSCTRIKRCGGCCTHPLLSCQPVESEVRNFVVVVSKINGEGRLNYRNKEIIPLEEHTSCKCSCRIKNEHCTEKQEYVEDECRCRCINSDEESKCKRSNDTKLWDPDACNCLCRNVEACNTGWYFDQNTCRCRQIPASRWFGDSYRFRQTTKNGDAPPVIVPLDASDPRRKHKDEPDY